MKIHLMLSGIITAVAAAYLFFSQTVAVAAITTLGLSGVWIALVRRLQSPSPANRIGMVAVIVLVGTLLHSWHPQLRGLPMQRFYMLYLGTIAVAAL